jgi:hypothetical protein
MAQNNFNNGPGGRLKKEEKKNILYVSNPNDPRLKSYQDSLAAYNYGEKLSANSAARIEKLLNVISEKEKEGGIFEDKWRYDERPLYPKSFRGVKPIEAKEMGFYQMDKPPYRYPEEIPEEWPYSEKFLTFKKPEREVALSKQQSSAPRLVDMSFLRPNNDIAAASPSTTSVNTPVPRIAESGMYLQKNAKDLKNLVVADVANAIGLDVANMNPEQYKRVATVIEELNKKHGNPSLFRNKGRAFYEVFSNSLNILPEKKSSPHLVVDSSTINRPDEYFQELAHSSQYAKEPIKSYIKSTKGKLLYEDSDRPKKGRYAIPGELEYEAHKEIAPHLWNEFKSLYKNKYGEDVPPQYENSYKDEQEKLNDRFSFFSTNKAYKGTMLPEVSIVAPVKRP